MDPLTLGLVAHVNQTYQGSHNDFYNSIGGRFYEHGAVPKNAVKPYCTFNYPGSGPEYFFDLDIGELILIDLQIVSTSSSSEEIGSIHTKMKTHFDKCIRARGNWEALSVTGYKVVSCRRTSEVLLPLDPIDGQRIWTTTYSIYLYSTS